MNGKPVGKAVDVETGEVAYTVPCGRCAPCLKRRTDQWIFRIQKEELNSSSSLFVTLTYNTTHIPITRNKYMSLRRKDFQDFMKRLRSLQEYHKEELGEKYKYQDPIKYYGCGEYGDQRKRPHYHAIILNADPDLIQRAWMKQPPGSPAGTKTPIGSIYIGDVTTSSIAYTCKYLDKKVDGQRKMRHDRDDRESEFSMMSKNLGASYLTKEVIKYHRGVPERNYLHGTFGKKVPIPKYYANQIWDDTGFKEQRIKVIRSEMAKTAKEHERIFYLRFPNATEKDYQYWCELEREQFENKFKNGKKRKF